MNKLTVEIITKTKFDKLPDLPKTNHLADIAKKIPAWVANIPVWNENYNLIVEHQKRLVDMEVEKSKADSIGVTVQELRIIEAFPDLIDWSKVGSRIPGNFTNNHT